MKFERKVINIVKYELLCFNSVDFDKTGENSFTQPYLLEKKKPFKEALDAIDDE